MSEENNQLVLISGESTTGKTMSLKNLRDHERWLYLNTEAGKQPPFRHKFSHVRISDPYQVHEGFQYIIDNPDEYKGIIVDSATFMMDMLESQYVLTAANTQKAWGEFAQFFKILMQSLVVQVNKPTIFLAHTLTNLDDSSPTGTRTAVPVKGSLKNNGLEAYFSTVVSTKRMPLRKLEPYLNNGLLNITEDDEILGYKHVFQTRPTKETAGERIRSPDEMFTREQTYIDNDAQILLDHLNKFYTSF